MGLRGPKKGAKYKPTITKELQREALREIVSKHMERMTSAQIEAACGLKYLVCRSAKGGKFEPVTREQVDAGLFEREDVIIEVWDKQPSTPAFTDLMNRALDKAKEQEQEINLGGALEIRWKGEGK
jgi:hypothetical protein